MKNLLYKKFNIELKILEKENGSDIFRLLSPVKLERKDREPEGYANDRQRLKNEIVMFLEKPEFNPIGVYYNNELIGASFSSYIEEEGAPWLGYFYIKPEYRKGKAPVVLIHYLINHLYKGKVIQMRPSNTGEYSKLIRTLPKMLGFSVFKDGIAERLQRICKDGYK